MLFGGFARGPASSRTVPRLLRRLLVPGTVYRLYGIRYWVLPVRLPHHELPIFVNLFGDSSYIVGYLRWVGYRVPRTARRARTSAPR